jgi:hypothetical protein
MSTVVTRGASLDIASSLCRTAGGAFAPERGH